MKRGVAETKSALGRKHRWQIAPPVKHSDDFYSIDSDPVEQDCRVDNDRPEAGAQFVAFSAKEGVFNQPLGDPIDVAQMIVRDFS